MKMTMVLLVSSVALLVGATNNTLVHNKIINLISEIEKKPQVLHRFVENVKEQDSDCGKVFFCKVQDVVKPHRNTELKDLFEQLKHYNKARNVNCTEELKDKESNRSKVQLKELMTDVVLCMKKINMCGEKCETGRH